MYDDSWSDSRHARSPALLWSKHLKLHESRRLGGFPVPRIYQSQFERPASAVRHWHWFWSAADVAYVLLPPAPSLIRAEPRPAVIEALANALVADLLAELEADTAMERNTDDR
jgi:hypothetical protein